MSRKSKDNKRKSKQPTVIDNTDEKYEVSIEKNSAFDFDTSSDSSSDETQQETPKKKFNIQLSDVKVERKTLSSSLRAMPPSKTRQTISKPVIERAIESLEMGEYSKAQQYFNAHAVATESKKEAQFCLCYQIVCSLLNRIIVLQEHDNPVFCSVLFFIPLLPTHRETVLMFAKMMITKYDVVLPMKIIDFVNDPNASLNYSNEDKEMVTCMCPMCQKIVNRLGFCCDCGKNFFFDCETFELLDMSYSACQKCGARYNDNIETCPYCKGHVVNH